MPKRQASWSDATAAVDSAGPTPLSAAATLPRGPAPQRKRAIAATAGALAVVGAVVIAAAFLRHPASPTVTTAALAPAAPAPTEPAVTGTPAAPAAAPAAPAPAETAPVELEPIASASLVHAAGSPPVALHPGSHPLAPAPAHPGPDRQERGPRPAGRDREERGGHRCAAAAAAGRPGEDGRQHRRPRDPDRSVSHREHHVARIATRVSSARAARVEMDRRRSSSVPREIRETGGEQERRKISDFSEDHGSFPSSLPVPLSPLVISCLQPARRRPGRATSWRRSWAEDRRGAPSGAAAAGRASGPAACLRG